MTTWNHCWLTPVLPDGVYTKVNMVKSPGSLTIQTPNMVTKDQVGLTLCEKFNIGSNEIEETIGCEMMPILRCHAPCKEIILTRIPHNEASKYGNLKFIDPAKIVGLWWATIRGTGHFHNIQTAANNHNNLALFDFWFIAQTEEYGVVIVTIKDNKHNHELMTKRTLRI